MKVRLPDRVRKTVLTPWRWFKKLRRRNKVFVIIGLVILFSVISGQIAEATKPPPFETQAAKRVDIVQVVSETGNVDTGGRVDVYSTATGFIEELYVTNGQRVSIDDPLFKVRSTASDQEIAAAYASYQSAVSAQKTAEQAKLAADATMWTEQKALLDAKEAKRVKDDHKDQYEDLEEQSIDAGLAQAEKDFKSAETKYKEADIAVTAAKAQVASTRLAYEATKNDTIYASTNGTVANLSVSVGDNVQAGGPISTANAGAAALTTSAASAATGGSPVLTIANLSSNYSIKLALNEIDIPKVKQGQEATIELDAFSGKKFRGVVTHVDAVGTNTQGVVTYNILIAIQNPDATMKPGMTADVDIVVDKAVGVLAVPNSAVKPYKGGKSVRIIDPKNKNELKNIPVEVGLKGETNTQILKGLEEGQMVVTAVSNEKVERSGGPF